MVTGNALPPLLLSILQACSQHSDKSLDPFLAAFASRPPAIREIAAAIHFHVQGDMERALDHAASARSLAPGSPWLRALPYFLSHPDGFDAPFPPYLLSAPDSADSPQEGIDPVLVDAWIQGIQRRQLGDPDASRPSSDVPEAEPPASDDLSLDLDDVASETLARILRGQGRHDEAERMLRKLNKDRKA